MRARPNVNSAVRGLAQRDETNRRLSFGVLGAGLALSLSLAIVVMPTSPSASNEDASDRRSTVTVFEGVAYSLSYPAHWGPSTNTYANAFELRNYGPNRTIAVPERNRASVIVVHTVNDTADVARRYFDGLGGSAFDLGGYPAKRSRHRVGPEELGPGMRRSDGEEDVGGAPDHWVISTHVVNGRVLLAVEGRAPVTADAEVVDEILRIEDSVRFVSVKKEEVQ